MHIITQLAKSASFTSIQRKNDGFFNFLAGYLVVREWNIFHYLTACAKLLRSCRRSVEVSALKSRAFDLGSRLPESTIGIRQEGHLEYNVLLNLRNLFSNSSNEIAGRLRSEVSLFEATATRICQLRSAQPRFERKR